MNLKTMSDDNLIVQCRKIAKDERLLLIKVLEHLREVDRRRLFAGQQYPSLLAFARGEMGYSEDEAVRRISAMRLMREIPEIQMQIQSGELSLTNIGLAQALFSRRRKKGEPCDKRAILDRLAGKSSREARRIVEDIEPEMKRRPVSFQDFDDELRDKLLRLKGDCPDLESLLHKLCDAALQAAETPSTSAAPRVKMSAVQRKVWQRDGGACCNCGSRVSLQFDHRHPKAAGGRDSPENLRLLCRTCNQRAAIEYYGIKKMGRYIPL